MEAGPMPDSGFPFFCALGFVARIAATGPFFCFRRLASEPEVRPLRIAAERAAGVFLSPSGEAPIAGPGRGGWLCRRTGRTPRGGAGAVEGR